MSLETGPTSRCNSTDSCHGKQIAPLHVLSNEAFIEKSVLLM